MIVDFNAVYDKYYSKIYNYVYYRLLNKENTEDVVGEVFLKAFNNIENFDGKYASVSTWLFKIATNTVNNYVRKNVKITFIPIENTEPVEEFTVLDNIIANENVQELQKNLQTLDERSRTIIALRYWGELSYAEIAEQTGLTEKNVSVILSRAIATLRNLFDISKI